VWPNSSRFGTPHSPRAANFFRMRSSENRAHNSFGMRSSKNTGLKVL
jgi:hypothetical protein